MDEDLQLSRFVDWGVEESEEALCDGLDGCRSSVEANVEVEAVHPNLVRDVWPCVADIPVHLPHDADMLVAVQEGIFLVPYHSVPSAMRGFIRFEASIR